MAQSVFAKLHRRFGQPANRAEIDAAVNLKSTLLEEGIPIEQETISSSPLEAKQSIAVVGAGLAGLAAAYYLTREGCNVTVFEARNSIGGRVKTLDTFVPNRLIEAGAELIGLNHPLWLKLAQRFGLSLSVLTPEVDFSGAGLQMPIFTAKGTLNASAQKKLFDEMDAAYKTLNADAALVDPYHPWRSPKAKLLDNASVEMWIRSLSCCSAETKNFLAFELENDQTVPVNQQSYLGLLAAVKGGALTSNLSTSTVPSEYWTHTEVFRCADGNRALADKLLQAASHSGAVILCLDESVIEIDLTDGAIVSTTKKLHQVFDWVVLAVPPSVLNRIRYAGPVSVIPNAILSNGHAVKYLSHVSDRFWIRNSSAPSGADTTLGSFWEGTDNQMATSNSDFDLSLFSGGSNAGNVVKQPLTALDKDIERVFPGYISAKQGGQLVNWPNEAWIETGYSCPAIDEVTTKGKFLNGLHRRLVFAGEHTCMAYFGYMEGALQSGLRAASQILGRKPRP